MAVTWKKLAYVDDVVLKSLFDAQTILAAVSDNTPAAVTVAEQTIVGRKTGGNIAALTAAEVLVILGLTVPPTPANHAPSHKNSGSDELLLSDFGEPTAAVKFDGQEATNLVVHNVANSTVRLALTPLLGKVCFQVDELAPYICTVIA